MDELLETLCDNVPDESTAYALTKLAPIVAEVLAAERAQASAESELEQQQIHRHEADQLRQRNAELEVELEECKEHLRLLGQYPDTKPD